MSDVIKFPGAGGKSGESHRQSMLRQAQELVARIEAGEVDTVGIAMTKPDGSVSTCYSGGNQPLLIAAIAVLQHRVINDR